MADPILNFGAGMQGSMGAGLRMPRTDLRSNLPELGPQGIRSGLADVEVERQQALDRITGLGGGAGPRLQPPPESAMQAGPGIYYSPGMDRFSVGGVEFGREDYDVALQSPSYLGRQAPEPGGDFRRISPTEYQGYLASISEGRGFLGNLGVGFQNVGEGLVAGTGRGLQMLGAEGAGAALVSAGEAIGMSDAERARSAAISGEQSLLGQIGTATVQSAPTLGVSVGAGLGGAAAGFAVGGPAGAAIGGLLAVAASIFPMELQSSWEAAEQNGLDPTDPNVQSDIIMSTLFKTGVQTAGPAVIARGFSPALQRIVGDVTGRTLGQRITRGVGAGALEGSAEAIAQITDRVVFDPELRALLNEADIAALAPLVAQRHGEEALVAFGAGFLLGGPLGAMGTPTRPRLDVNSGRPVDALSGARLDPQAVPGTQGELFAGANLGQAPAAPQVAPTQGEMFSGQPLGVAPDERQLEMFPGYTIPSQQPGFQMPLPLQGAPAAQAAPEVQLQLPLQAAPGMQADLFGTTPPFPQAAPVAPTAPAGPLQLQPQMRAEPGQVEMFTAPEMGLPATTQARLTGQPLAGAPRPAITAPPEVSQAELEVAGQRRMELTTQPTAMGEQLNLLLQQQQARQEAEAAAQTSAVRGAEFEAAQEQAAQQREEELLRARADLDVAADVAWEQFRPGVRDTEVTFEVLTDAAQRRWAEAVRTGRADAGLYNALRTRTDPRKVRRRKAQADELAEARATLGQRGRLAGLSMRMFNAQERILTNELQRRRGAPSALPTGVLGTKDGQPFKSELAARGQRTRVASRENIPANRLEPVEVPGGWGLQVRPETPPKAGAPKKGGPDAVRKPSPKESTLRQESKASKGVRGEDTQGQEATGARGPDTFEQTETPAQRRVAPTPGRGLSQAEREAAAKSARAADLLIGRDRRQPPKRTQEQLEADRAREEAARAEAARRTEVEAAARREAQVPAETPVVPVAQSEAAQAWAEAQRENPDIDLDYDALPNAEKARWAKEVRAGKQTAEKARRTYERVVGPLAEREAAAETEALVVAIQDLELDVVQRGFDGDKQDAAVELMRLMSDPNTPTDIQNDIRGILEGNLTPSQYLTIKQQAAALEQQMSGAPRELLGVDMDTQIIVQTMSDLNNGKLRDVTPMIRSKLRDAWNKIKGTDPDYAKGDKLANYIDENSPGFFVLGPRGADGIRPVVSKATGRNKLSSYNVITNPIPMGKAKMATSNFVARLATKPKVRVYRNVEEFQRKAPELFAEADAARPQGDFATVQASGYSFGDGNVLIFTDNIVDEAHLKAVLAHETMGHFGMRGLLPQAQFNSLMDAVYDTSEVVRSAADAAVANRGLSKAEATEEYLADFAAVLDTSLIARIWNTLKNALNKLGVKFGDDSARYLVTQARRYVRNGQTSGVFNNAEIAQRLHSIESGQDPDGTGRFAPANTLSGFGIQAGLLDGSTLPYTKQGLISNFRNIADTWDRVKADVFSLTNYRAKQNPGLKRFYDLVLGANRLSMRYKNESNEAMAMYLNPSLNLGFTRLGDGVSRNQKETVDSMVYAAQRYAVSKFDLKPDARRPGLIQLVDGEPVVNQPRLEELRKQGRRTVEEFRDGFTYTVYDEVPMTDAQRQVLRTQRDNELAQAKTDPERKAIETDYKAQIDAETFLQPREERFPGVPGLTKDSIEWKAYVAARETVERMEVELLKAHYIAHLKTVDNQLYEIDEAMNNRMTAQDRQFLLRMNEQYRTMYTTNLTINEDGQVVIDPQSMEDADKFVQAVNSAVIATRGSDRNAAVLAYFDQADQGDINARIEDFKTRFSPRTEQEKFVVQNKIKEIAVDEISRNDNGFFTERTIATGYTPVLREGRFQVRMVAVDPDTGRPLKMKDTFQQQLSYHQIASTGEAAVLRDRVNELFDGTTHDVAVWDSADRVYKVKKVKLMAKAEQAVDAISAPPQLNLNEFVIGLRRFSINLDPRKMEEVVVTLTRQNSRARNRLQRTFQPGADTDAAKAISGHVESRASTIAKTVVRPDLDRLMNMNLDQTRKLWSADDTAKLDRLKATYEAAVADPNATPAKRVEAKRAFDEYTYQRQNTLREDKDGVGMAQRYYSEAAKALSFMESQKNLDESDFGSGDTISQVRAATSMMQLGASPATAALNLIALGTNTLPYLAAYNPKTAFGGGFGFGPAQAALFKAMRQVGAPGTLDGDKNTATYYKSLAEDAQALRKVGITRDEALFLAREIEEGVAIPALTNSLIASARGRMTGAASQKFVDGWMVFFNRTEQAARRSALLAAYRLQYDRGIQAGKDPEVALREARDFAVKTAEDTQGEYSVMNRPAIWRGGPQQFLYMYKIFPTMSVQLLANLPRKGQLLMIGGLIALSGLSGLPFAEDLEDLADTIAARLGLKTPSLRLEIARAIDEVMPGMSPMLINGFVNAFVPGDVGSRTSLGDLFPGTSIFLPGADVGRELLSIAGPVAGAAQGLLSTASGAGQWAAYTAGISDRPASLEGIARNAPVTMVRAWADAFAYVESGGVVDRRGYLVSDDLSSMEVMARALGFYPSAAAEQYGLIRVAQRVSNYQRDMAAAFYNAYVQARLRGDTAQANQVVREVREWNQEARGSGLEITNFQQNAIRRLRDARRSATERTLRYAPQTAREQFDRAIELLGY
jgi:hypothetical protein